MAITVVGAIAPSHSASTITAVAMRDITELDSDECTIAQSASGIWTASGVLDFTGDAAGYVTVYFIDETGEHVSSPVEFEIDDSGAEVDRLPYLDTAVASRLAPTTSGRTLDVTATGAAGIDWSNIEGAATEVNFSSTTVGTATNVTTLNGMANNVVTAAALAADAGAEIRAGLATSSALSTVGENVGAIKAKTDHLPSAAAGSNGGLPTVDANNRIAGIQGTINTLDALDTAQDSQHSNTRSAIADVQSSVGAINADITPPLQLDIDRDFTFDMPNRTSGVIAARNTIYLASKDETPHFAFDVSKIDRNKPATITSVEVLDDEGTATENLVVAEEDDTTNCGVKDYLVISKVTNCLEAGVYTIKVTYQVTGSRTYVVTGNIVVP